jgi:predicted double-glycine peptidase
MIQLGTTATVLLGSLAFWWGIRFGRVLVRKGSTADDLFIGKPLASIACLGIYIGLIFLALHLPQLQALPVEWRFYGMEVSWVILRIILLGFCGLAFIVSWRTVRWQAIAVILIGILGLGAFHSAEAYFSDPIYASLENNLRPNGVYHQTSESSCAPAAMATVLHRWDLNETESSIARLAGTSRLGTSMPQLVVAAREIGMEALEISPATWEQMRQINRPGVLATWLVGRAGNRVAHATALLGIREDAALVADPAFGRIYAVPRARFQEIWRNQYVPIFRPEETVLSRQQAIAYLEQLNYWPSSGSSLATALQNFQTAMDIDVTGELNPITVLLLRGPFLEQVPTLNDPVADVIQLEQSNSSD